jgi:hypothetical protein
MHFAFLFSSSLSLILMQCWDRSVNTSGIFEISPCSGNYSPDALFLLFKRIADYLLLVVMGLCPLAEQRSVCIRQTESPAQLPSGDLVVVRCPTSSWPKKSQGSGCLFWARVTQFHRLSNLLVCLGAASSIVFLLVERLVEKTVATLSPTFTAFTFAKIRLLRRH